jgi:hypothetical protein
MALYTPFVEKSVNTVIAGQQQKQQTDLAQSAYMGDPNALGQLYGINPQLAEKIKRQKQQDQQNQLAQQASAQKQQQSVAKSDQDMSKYQRAEMEKVKERMAKMPFEQAKEYGRSEAMALGIEPPGLTSEMHDQIKSGFSKEKSGFEGLIDAFKNAEEGSTDKELFRRKLEKEVLISKGIKVNPDGTVEIGGAQENVALDRPNTRQAQEKIISASESLQRLDRIKENYNPEFLTYAGRFNKTISSIMSKAGMDLSAEDKSMVKQYRKFTQGVNTEFNAYRKLITGAAASVQELESLKNAMISTDLSPADFEGAFEEYKTELSRVIRIRNRLLREGVSTTDKTFGDTFDDEFMNGGDDDIGVRGDELEAQGMEPEKIVEALRREGYM